MYVSYHCLLKASEVQENPGINTTGGLLGLPVASAQIWVPSREVTQSPMTEAARERAARSGENFMMMPGQ